jgi:hypothetical protein
MTNHAKDKQIPISNKPTPKRRVIGSSIFAKWRQKKSVSPELKNEEQDDAPKKPTRWVQIRIIPIWLRLIIVFVLAITAMFVGYNIGYSVIGDGSSDDTFSLSTWRHILDIINGKE